MIPKSAQQAAETAVAETEWHTLPELLEAYKSLQNELETLRKDKARLDWLESNGSVEVKGIGSWLAVDHITGKVGRGDTIRAAIDAAMASKPGE